MLIVDAYLPNFLSEEAAELRILLKEKVADRSPSAQALETTASDVIKDSASPPSVIQRLFSWFQI
jgi:hypothetical protein